MSKVVYTFNENLNGVDLKAHLGGKGAGLNAMFNMGVPVPPGFTIPTEFCLSMQKRETLPGLLEREVGSALEWVESEMSRSFDNYTDIPLLLSVRSGAPVSMPGMMDTILNLGMNRTAMIALSDNVSRIFALDSMRRFLLLYSSVVDKSGLSDKLIKLNKGYEVLFEGSPDKLKEIGLELLVREMENHVGLLIPTDPFAQLKQAIISVFKSWNIERAIMYRDIEGISHDMGTAVNVQAMVYGNLNEQSGTGVMFTFDPNTGEDCPYGDFLPRAQGEDVVSGAYKTLPLAEMAAWNFPVMEELIYTAYKVLEPYYGDMLDIEFTVEDGKLYILQSRVGKRTALADPIINARLLDRGVIDVAEMTTRVNARPEIVEVQTSKEEEFEGWEVIGEGKPACPGVISGIVFIDKLSINPDTGDYILVRMLTEPDDVPYMSPAAGILTGSGGVVSHAAVVARSWNKPCVVGADFTLDFWDGRMNITYQGSLTHVYEGEMIKIDGATGLIYAKTKDE